MTIVKQIQSGGRTETYEFNEQDYNTAVRLITTRPIPEILQELEQKSAESKRKFQSGLADIDSRYKPQVQEKERALDAARRAITQEEAAQRDDVNAGRYSTQPAHEAAILELKQKALVADMDYTRAQMDYHGARAIYLRPAANGSQGSGATIAGMDYSMFLNIVRTILYDWSGSKMGVDIVGQYSRQYEDANRWAVTYQETLGIVDGKIIEGSLTWQLEQFKQAAVAHFGGKPAQTPQPVVKSYQGGRPPVPPQYLNLDPFGNSK